VKIGRAMELVLFQKAGTWKGKGDIGARTEEKDVVGMKVSFGEEETRPILAEEKSVSTRS